MAAPFMRAERSVGSAKPACRGNEVAEKRQLPSDVLRVANNYRIIKYFGPSRGGEFQVTQIESRLERIGAFFAELLTKKRFYVLLAMSIADV